MVRQLKQSTFNEKQAERRIQLNAFVDRKRREKEVRKSLQKVPFLTNGSRRESFNRFVTPTPLKDLGNGNGAILSSASSLCHSHGVPLVRSLMLELSHADDSTCITPTVQRTMETQMPSIRADRQSRSLAHVDEVVDELSVETGADRDETPPPCVGTCVFRRYSGAVPIDADRSTYDRDVSIRSLAEEEEYPDVFGVDVDEAELSLAATARELDESYGFAALYTDASSEQPISEEEESDVSQNLAVSLQRAQPHHRRSTAVEVLMKSGARIVNRKRARRSTYSNLSEVNMWREAQAQHSTPYSLSNFTVRIARRNVGSSGKKRLQTCFDE